MKFLNKVTYYLYYVANLLGAFVFLVKRPPDYAELAGLLFIANIILHINSDEVQKSNQ